MHLSQLQRKNDGPEVFGHYGYPICITYACSIQCLRVLIVYMEGITAEITSRDEMERKSR